MRAFLCAMALAFVCGAAAGADNAAPVAASPILKMIPADSLGYVVVNNVNGLFTEADAYIKQIGLAELAGQEMPQGVLAAARKALNLGEGLDANGGAAFVLLDPAPLGLNLISMLLPASSSASAPSLPPVPYVVILPAGGLKPLLGAFEIEESKPYARVAMPTGDLYADARGGYILLSPTPKALDAMAAAKRTADLELSPAELKLASSSAAAAMLNCRVAAPMAQKVVNALNLMALAAKATDTRPPAELRTYLEFRQNIAQLLKAVNQMDRLLMAVQRKDAGLAGQLVIRYLPDTPAAKAVAAAGAMQPKPLLGGVRGGPYILAMDFANLREPEPQTMLAQLEAALQGAKQLKPARRDEAMAQLTKILQEVEGVQLLMAPGDDDAQGTIGITAVIRCQDSSRLQAMLAQSAPLADRIRREMLAPDMDANEFAIRCAAGSLKIGDVQADVISVECPADEQAMFKAMFGPHGLTALMAPAGKNTLVISLGGGVAGMTRALAAARSGDGKLLSTPEARQCLQHLGKNMQAVCLMNMSVYGEAINKTMVRLTGKEALATLQCKVPMGLAISIEDDASILSFYLPTELMREVCAGLCGPKTPSP